MPNNKFEECGKESCGELGLCFNVDAIKHQAETGGYKQDGSPYGPYWSRESWDRYMKRIIEDDEKNNCVQAAAIIGIINQLTEKKKLRGEFI